MTIKEIELTRHRNGKCVECLTDEFELATGQSVRDTEAVAWSRTKRKCLTIVTATAVIIALNFALANSPSGDDLVRGLVASFVTGFATWFGTSRKHDSKTEDD